MIDQNYPSPSHHEIIYFEKIREKKIRGNKQIPTATTTVVAVTRIFQSPHSDKIGPLW